MKSLEVLNITEKLGEMDMFNEEVEFSDSLQSARTFQIANLEQKFMNTTDIIDENYMKKGKANRFEPINLKLITSALANNSSDKAFMSKHDRIKGMQAIAFAD